MQIIGNQIREASFAFNTWSAAPPSGTSLDDVLQPEYWTHVHQILKAGDRIHVMPESGEWLAELVVRSSSTKGAVVAKLTYHDFNPKPAEGGEPSEAGEYEVKWAGGVAKWRVIRVKDRHVLVEKLATKEAAQAWLTENTKTDLV